MRIIKPLLAVLTAVAVLSVMGSLSQAAAPTAINYQGRLTNGGGSPVPDGSYSVAFTIYDAASGGTSKWTETQSVTTIGGFFAVLLGSVNPVTDSVFNGTGRYLGVKVGADPELTPRTRLVSVPYSERISTVDGSTGGAITGNISLDNSTAATGNIYKGGSLFVSNIGFQNTFVGQNAGNLTMGAGDNVGIGALALSNNANGQGNTAIGSGALAANTNGFANTASGALALTANSTGVRNTAFGTSALFSNDVGNGNTAAGNGALFGNKDGNFNTASGYNSLESNTSGSLNCAIGFYALFANKTGLNNTAVGAYALSSSDGVSGNTAVGQYALAANTTGGQNTATGGNSLYSNTTGIQNAAFGESALRSNTTGYQNTATGFQALRANVDGLDNTATGANCLDSNTSGNLNTASGVFALTSNTTGSSNTAFGVQSLQINTTGEGNTAVGRGALAGNVTGNNNTAIGNGAGPTGSGLSNTTTIGTGALATASNMVRIGGPGVTVIEGQVAYTFTSDRNQKEHFQPIDGETVLQKIRLMDLSSWNYKGQDRSKFRHYGPMAQDFYAAFGHDAIGQCGDSVTMNSGDEAGILMAAVQALEMRTADLAKVTAENEQIKAENKSLRADLDALKKQVTQLVEASKKDGSSAYSMK